jgi:TrmH family RNA methyltransferase
LKWHNSVLENIRIVLSNTSHPGNIGAAARAMKTMELSRLYLVNPKRYPDAEATARASGADDLLARATVCSDLETAIAGCQLVMGASARSRRIPCPIIDPASCAHQAVVESGQGEVAILFGCEQSGLSNAEIDRCQSLVQIPTNPVYGSLNLASAVQIISYEILVAQRQATVSSSGQAGPVHVPATAEELERYFEHLERVLIKLDFLDPDNPRKLMRRLRRLYNRARPDENEINILRGVLSATEQNRRE